MISRMILAEVSTSFTTENTTLNNEATTNPKMNTSKKYGKSETGIQNNETRYANKKIIYISVQWNIALEFTLNLWPGASQSSSITTSKTWVNETTFFSINGTKSDYENEETGKIVVWTKFKGFFTWINYEL